jgi:NAD(P)-dependent dehydrogenase (short-subunit alcohol dehydrogenase family)
MAGRLEGRVALVSGSTRGIGRSIAELFAAEGAKVAVTGRTVEKGQKVVDGIRERGGDAEFFTLDITSEDNVHEVVDAVAERFGGLSTLINNAAPTTLVSTTVKPLHEYSTEEFNAILGGALIGNVFWATKYAWPHLVAADGAAIVNISSGQSMKGYTGFGAYAASKGGMNSLTRTLAVEGQPHGIRCNAIIVGRVVSGRGDSGVGVNNRPGGVGNPMQIAYTTLFLASDESSFINGDLVTADGGLQMNGDTHMA